MIRGTSFAIGPDADKATELDRLETLFTDGGFEVVGEIGLQYQGMSPSDIRVDEYFALAERLDVPVAIHMGTDGSGQANVLMPNFRASMGDPLLLEELLARHRGLRVQIMFGTDQVAWPGLMAYSIGIIENADYLLPAQKRDILYNNAARFLRLDTTE